MATAEHAAPDLTCDDIYRIEGLAHRLAGALADDEIRVRIVGAVDMQACEMCPPDAPGERICGDVIVHYGHARPVYPAHVCAAHLGRFLAVRVRHDHARPRVDIPAVLGEPDIPAYPMSGPYSSVPVR